MSWMDVLVVQADLTRQQNLRLETYRACYAYMGRPLAGRLTGEDWNPSLGPVDQLRRFIWGTVLVPRRRREG